MIKKVILLVIIAIGFFGCDSQQEVQEVQKTSEVATKIDTNEPKITIQKGEAPKEENPFLAYNIDGERQIRVAVNGEENATTKSIGALASVRNPYERINTQLLEKRMSLAFITKCSACHNDYANGIIGPSLLKKSDTEIFDKIIAYRTKKETNVLMRELVMQMSEEEILAIAKEISQFNEQFRRQK